MHRIFVVLAVVLTLWGCFLAFNIFTAMFAAAP